MPETPIALFRDEQGHVPVQVWLAELELRRPKAFQKIVARILLLNRYGHELRRPHCDLLRDGFMSFAND